MSENTIIPASYIPLPDEDEIETRTSSTGTADEYKVESGHRVPAPNGAEVREKYPWSQMKVGDSFRVPPGEKGNVERAAANRNTRDPSKRFVVRTTRHGEIRCWRVSVPRKETTNDQFDLSDTPNNEVDDAGCLALLMLQNARRWQEYHRRDIPNAMAKIQEELAEYWGAPDTISDQLDEVADVLVNAMRVIDFLSPAERRFVAAVGLMKVERRIPPGPGKDKKEEAKIREELARLYLEDR